MTGIDRIGVIGFGEVGETIARAFLAEGASVTVVNRSPGALRAALSDGGLAVAESPAALAADSELVVSAVWPESAEDVAAAAAPGLDGTRYLDLNSVSPRTTRRAADTVAEGGGTFLKGIVRGAVARRGTDVRVEIAGPEREPAVAALAAAGFGAVDAGPDRERVAAFKMYRGLITKSFRQLFAEMLVPARERDLDGAVLDALSDVFADTTLDEWVRYATASTPPHAERRVGELEEILDTVEDAGYEAPTAARARDLHAFVAERDPDPDHEAVLDALTDYLRRADADGRGDEGGG